MFKDSKAFFSFCVNDLTKAKEFYENILGLPVTENPMGLKIQFATGEEAFVYAKEDHKPADYTILNFPVENIDEAMDKLKEKGVEFEMYEGMHQDEKGVTRGLAANMGPDIAWFKDPAGNIISILQEK